VNLERELRAVMRDEVKAVLRDELPGLLGRVQTEETSHLEYVSPDRAAKIVGIGLTTIRKLLRSGKLPCVRVGRLIRVPLRDLDAALRAGALGDRGVGRSVDEHAAVIIERMRARGAGG
jgi:excisionase family DNA binding protein